MGRSQKEFEEFVGGLPLEDRSTAMEGIEAGMDEQQVRTMCDQARFLRDMRCPDSVAPRPGFSARVMARIEADRPSSIWDVFVSPMLAKQLAFASLVLMAMLAGFVVARSSDHAVMEAQTQRILMRQEHPENLGMDPARDRQNMFAALASYRGDE